MSSGRTSGFSESRCRAVTIKLLRGALTDTRGTRDKQPQERNRSKESHGEARTEKQHRQKKKETNSGRAQQQARWDGERRSRGQNRGYAAETREKHTTTKQESQGPAELPRQLPHWPQRTAGGWRDSGAENYHDSCHTGRSGRLEDGETAGLKSPQRNTDGRCLQFGKKLSEIHTGKPKQINPQIIVKLLKTNDDEEILKAALK